MNENIEITLFVLLYGSLLIAGIKFLFFMFKEKAY